MGRNTFNELSDDLDNSKKIVLSKTKKFDKEVGKDVTVVDNVLESMFNLFMDYAQKMYITKVDKTIDGADAFFPEICMQEWEEKILNQDKEDNTKFSFVEYTKKD